MRGDPRIDIGGIARAHGIRGEVVIVTHDPDSEILSHVETIWVDGVEKKLLRARATHRGWLVELEGVATRNDAEALQGKQVAVDRATLELHAGDVLLDDLVGCKVVLVDGREWGTIAAIELGVQDLLIIHDGDIERMLPLVDNFVKNIDVEAGVVTIDPPEGIPEHRLRK